MKKINTFILLSLLVFGSATSAFAVSEYHTDCSDGSGVSRNADSSDSDQASAQSDVAEGGQASGQ